MWLQEKILGHQNTRFPKKNCQYSTSGIPFSHKVNFRNKTKKHTSAHYAEKVKSLALCNCHIISKHKEGTDIQSQ